MKQVVELKKKSIEGLGKHDLLDGFTVDTPVPYRLAGLIDAIAEKDREMVQGSKGEKQGPLFGKLTRFLNRISVKTKDRRYAFMYQAPAEYETYEALHQLAEKLLGTGVKQVGVNPGIKIVDFSEVPSDILPVVVGLVARIVYQIQFWSSPGADGDARHPIVLVCDEAHLYLPSSAASTGPLEKRALENYERIAKEGRKYGVGLMVVSQRPSDVSTTILSQCSNIISLRLANKTDQAVVKQLLPESLEGLMSASDAGCGRGCCGGRCHLLPTRIKMAKPKHEPRSATIPFWTRWATPKAEVDLVAAVENMRRQSRAQEA